jgi:GTP cyclohydrolase I
MPNDGVIVVCTGEHLCMKMRGVEKQDSATTTLEYTGRFAEEPALRDEFMRLLSL